MLPNEEFALACLRYYEEQGLIVDETNGEFAHCPLPKGMGETGYYLLWEHHQQQGLLQSRDVDRKCFFNTDVKEWLLKADYFPDNFFELWDIYEHYTREHVKNSLRSPDALVKRDRAMANFSKEQIERRNLAIKQAYQRMTPEERKWARRHQQKQVEITFPTGRVGLYYSRTFAAQCLGIHSYTLKRWIDKKTTPQGEHLGIVARYV